MLKKLLKFLTRERFELLSLAVCIVLLATGITCQSKTRSVIHPERKVARDELMAEINTFNSQVEARIKDLDRQDAFRRQLLDAFALWTTTGALNPAGIIPLLVTILGVGAMSDNVAKRIQIKKLNHAG